MCFRENGGEYNLDNRVMSWNNRAVTDGATDMDKLKKEIATIKSQLLSLSNTPVVMQTSGETQRWYDGVDTPLNTVGVDGDYFLQVDNGDIYKKVLGSWSRIGNLKGKNGSVGEQGSPGLPGENGSDGLDGVAGTEWHDGIGEPSIDLGKTFDYYLDVYNGDVYTKDGYWERVGNFVPSVDHVDDVVAAKLEVLQQQVDALEQGVADAIVSAEENVVDMHGRVDAAIAAMDSDVAGMGAYVDGKVVDMETDVATMDTFVTDSVNAMNLFIEDKTVEMEERVTTSTTTIRAEMDNIQAEYDTIVESVTPTQQDIDDIMNMITM